LRRLPVSALRSSSPGLFQHGETPFRQGCSARDLMRGVLQSVSTACPSSSPGTASAASREDVPRSHEKGRPGPLGARAGLIFCRIREGRMGRCLRPLPPLPRP
jgi:hypothetical protein